MRKIVFILVLTVLISAISIQANNCPQEISQKLRGLFEEKFTGPNCVLWSSVTLLKISCTQEKNGIMITIDYRSTERNIAIKGWFANWKPILGSPRMIFQLAFGFPQVIHVKLNFYNPYLDEFGNRFFKHEVTMEMDCDLAKKINWANFTDDMLGNLLDKRGLVKIVNGEKIQENQGTNHEKQQGFSENE